MGHPLDDMGIKREHIIALHEAYTQTNKKKSDKRAQRLHELFKILKKADQNRESLYWDVEDDVLS